MLRILTVLALLLAACRPSPPDPETPPLTADTLARADDTAPRLRSSVELDSIFAGMPGAFVVLDAARHDTLRYGDTAARTLPASTYKIPHSLLALEAGAAPDTTLGIAYDPARDPRQAWWPADWAQEQTLGTAFRRSAVWYYRELARRLGRDRAQTWLDTLGYGNRRIGPDVDGYWLDNALLISPDEQVAFLDGLFARRLPASPAHQDAVVALMRLDAGPDWAVYGKTGTGDDETGKPVAWLVGAARRGAAVYPYALRIRPATDAQSWSRPERLARVERMLRAVGVLP